MQQQQWVLAMVVGGIALSASLPLQAEEDWQFTARINGWLPDISGELAVGGDGADDDFNLDIDDIIEDVEFAFMGALEARKGRWGVLTDFMYSSVGDDNKVKYSGPQGAQGQLDVDLDVDTWIVNAAGFYRVLEGDALTLDLLGGLRYTDIEQDIAWSIERSLGGQALPGRNGGADVEVDNWDAIVGVRGRVPLTENGLLFVPFYVDVGAGDSDFTWQAAAGLGYAMGTMHIGLVWRYLDYDLDSSAMLSDFTLSGPSAEFEFTW